MSVRALLSTAVLCFIANTGLGDVAVVTSQSAGQLSFVDTAQGKVLATVGLLGKPAALAVSDEHVAVVAVETKILHLFDLAGREIAQHPFDGAPFGVAFDAASGDLLVTDAAGPSWLYRLSVPDLAVRDRLQVAANPTGIDSDKEGYVVVAARDADLALIYPPGCQGCTPQAVPVGKHPFGVTLEAGRAYVTNVLSDDVSVIDLAWGREIARIPTAERPYAVAFSAGRGFVSNQYAGSLTVFDAADFRVIAEIATGDYPEGVSATSEGGIAVAAWFSDLLQIFDATTLALRYELEMPEGPRAFGRFTTASPMFSRAP